MEKYNTFKVQVNGWDYVDLTGTAQDIGFWHGYLLGDQIKNTIESIALWSKEALKLDWSFYREMALQGMSWFKWGKSCGQPFYADKFLEERIEYAWQKPYLRDYESYPWVKVGASNWLK